MISRLLSRHLWVLYVAFWIAVAAIQFALLVQNYSFSNGLAIADSFIFTVMLALVGVGSWFMVQYSGRAQSGWYETVIFHLTGLAFAMLIWIGSGYFIMKSVGASDKTYIDFLDDTITFRVLAGLLIYLLILAVFYLMMFISEVKDRMEREKSLTEMLREAELNKLRAQIKPHFLFNSLNSVSALTLTDPIKAQEMVIKLSEFMRYSLSMAEESMSTLKNELYHVGLYLDIEKVRFSDRMIVEETIDQQCENWPIPAMILQPLLENAVKHGVYSLSEPSAIQLNISCSTEYLNVLISNSFDPDRSPRKGTGTGLKNVMKRLSAIYGRNDLLTVTQLSGTFTVSVRLPVKGLMQPDSTVNTQSGFLDRKI